jgi:hypothetical protein
LPGEQGLDAHVEVAMSSLEAEQPVYNTLPTTHAPCRIFPQSCEKFGAARRRTHCAFSHALRALAFVSSVTASLVTPGSTGRRTSVSRGHTGDEQ